VDQDSRAIEQIKKEIQKIRQAGANAETFGWILLILAAIVIWFLNNKALVIGVFAVMQTLGLYFIYSGKYIKVGCGHKTKTYLRLNALVFIPLSLAIIPLFLCIQSFQNLKRYKKLPLQIQTLYSKPKKLGLPWWQFVLLALLVIISIGSLILQLKDLNTTPVVSTGSNSSTTIDTASKSHFTITFPGSFTAQDLTKQVSGHDVAYAAYVSPVDSSQVYDLYAYNYPPQYFNYAKMPASQLAPAVHTALLSTVDDLHGKLVKSSPTTYASYTAEEGEFTSQTLTGSMTGYIRVFYVGNYQYSIVTIGVDQTNFDKFANSFKYK
jgi:hypothetical protein